MERRALRVVFVSSNTTWGGSEELWSAAAAEFARRGHRVSVLKGGIDEAEPRIATLRALGCRVTDLFGVPGVTRVASTLLPRLGGYALLAFHFRLWLALRLSRGVDLVVVSQGGNADGWRQGRACQRMGLPYVLVIQKATDLYWPPDRGRDALRATYGDARWCYFVSDHNRRLTEEQLGLELPHASVVRNPFLVSWNRRDDWPDERDGLRLACVARLVPGEKGQDMLLRVLARDKWRARALSVTFFGRGQWRAGLEGLARYLKLERVSFAGFVRRVDAIWDSHHALVLPSRCEGLALALVEAMVSGRVPIVTDVAGAREVVDDDATGFLAAAPTEDALDEALERAWQRRAEWRAIGRAATESIRRRVPADPAAAFADMLERTASHPYGAAALAPSLGSVAP
jgi:glycosyltransferase involved in cell wall biosynthesis